MTAGQGEVPGGDTEPDRGRDQAGDFVVHLGQQVPVLVVHGEAMPAGDRLPPAVELAGEVGSVAGPECIVHLPAQHHGVDTWDGRGQDLPLRDSRGDSPLAPRPTDDPAVPDEHREQFARLKWATRHPNIGLGILPMSPAAVWRSTGFVICDKVEDGDPLVHIEWLTRPYNESEPETVETCRRAFTNLLSA